MPRSRGPTCDLRDCHQKGVTSNCFSSFLGSPDKKKSKTLALCPHRGCAEPLESETGRAALWVTANLGHLFYEEAFGLSFPGGQTGSSNCACRQRPTARSHRQPSAASKRGVRRETGGADVSKGPEPPRVWGSDPAVAAAYLCPPSRGCPSHCARPPGRPHSAACAAGSACGTPRRPGPPSARCASPGSGGEGTWVRGVGTSARTGGRSREQPRGRRGTCSA